MSETLISTLVSVVGTVMLLWLLMKIPLFRRIRESKNKQLTPTAVEKRTKKFWFVAIGLTTLIALVHIEELASNFGIIMGALIVFGLPLTIINLTRDTIRRGLLWLWNSPIIRATVAAYLAWVLLLLFTNALRFEEVFDMSSSDQDRFWVLATLPPIFILICATLFYWAFAAFKKQQKLKG